MSDPAGVRPLDAPTCAAAEVLNLGAGSGRWLLQEAQRLGVKNPVGIDNNAAKVARAQAAGLPIYHADFMDLDAAAFPSVKIVVFDNVLEHLPSPAVAEDALTRAWTIASHVVHVRHPSFEHEEYLAALGLKQYWTDWPGVHTAHIRLHEFVAMAARHGVYDIAVHPVKSAHDSSDPTILPLGAPPNQRKTVRGPEAYGVYDEAAHGPKPSVKFDQPVYFAFDVFFFLNREIPAVGYRGDPDEDVARPVLTWNARGTRSPSPRTSRFRRVTRPRR